MTPAERAEWDALGAEMHAHALRLRALAERAQAKLDENDPVAAARHAERVEKHGEGMANALRTRELAERGQAELDARRRAAGETTS